MPGNLPSRAHVHAAIDLSKKGLLQGIRQVLLKVMACSLLMLFALWELSIDTTGEFYTKTSHLPFHQTFEEIEAVAITLQSPDFACCSVFPAKLLRKKKAPIPRDTLDASFHAALGLKCHDLVGVQPMLVVHLLEGLVKACANEFAIHC